MRMTMRRYLVEHLRKKKKKLKGTELPKLRAVKAASKLDQYYISPKVHDAHAPILMYGHSKQ
ncbi:hypothetical protein Csa_017625 [Cucumis sativus]|uniref:Uncharacterized protein n=1 Tax=Cucumis sativus TaxID=3659 RepID=A0A0A0LBX8_CUCSA|nr:hypothetical protein Csa_017625 [Cucumis sativus]